MSGSEHYISHISLAQRTDPIRTSAFMAGKDAEEEFCLATFRGGTGSKRNVSVILSFMIAEDLFDEATSQESKRLCR